MALGTFFEGEAALLAGGAAAHRGLLHLPLVIVAGCLGAFLGDQTWFRVGRRFGAPALASRPGLAAKAERAQRALQRWGALFVLGFRFVYGIRVVTPLLLGATHYPPRRFLLLNALGASVWAISVGYAGFGAVAAISELLEHLRH